MNKSINKMFAFLAENEDGEGLIAMNIEGAYVPFIGGDMERINSLKDHARRVSSETGKNVHLVVYENRRIVETYKGGLNVVQESQ